MRWILLLLLLMVMLASPASALSINTYRDAGYSQAADVFADNSTVFLSISDGITCCDKKTISVLNQRGESIAVEVNDEMGTGEYRGSFVISSNMTTQNSLNAYNNEKIIINASLTKISSGIKIIYTEYTKPANVSLSVIFVGNGVELNWTPSVDPMGIWYYQVYRYDEGVNGSKSPAKIFTSSSTSFVDRTVADGRGYYYSVSAIDNLGTEGEQSNIVYIRTPDVTSPNPIETINYKLSPDGVVLSWPPSSDNVGISHYLVLRDNKPIETIDSPIANINQTTFIDSNVSDGQLLYYSVVAVDWSGNKGKIAAVISVVVDKKPPETVNLSYTLGPNGAVNLKWPHVKDAVLYKIYHSPYQITDTTGLNYFESTSNTYTDFPSGPRYYSVAGIDSIGNEGSLSNIVFAEPDSTPPLPPSLKVSANSAGILLEWERSPSVDVAYYKIYRNDALLSKIDTEASSFIDSKVKSGTEYRYAIRAVDAAGNEGNSTAISIIANDSLVLLNISHPKESEIAVSQSQLIIIGETDAGSTVTITGSNGTTNAIVDSKGNFVGYANLVNGENMIIVRAEDFSGNSNEKVIKVSNAYRQTATSFDIEKKMQNLSNISEAEIKEQFSDFDPFLTGLVAMKGSTNILIALLIVAVIAIFLLTHRKLSDIKKILRVKMHYDYQREMKLKEEKRNILNNVRRYISRVPKNPSRLEKIKKEITVLFADIRNFTSISNKLGAENTARLLDMFYNKMAKAAYKFSGTVTEYVGDRILIIFNLEKEIKDHTLSAVRAAFEMKKELNLLNERLSKKFGMSIGIGIGIKAGEGVVGTVGHRRALKDAVTGDVINIASKLANIAKAGDILIDSSTYEKIKSNISASKPVKVSIEGLNIVVHNILTITGQ